MHTNAFVPCRNVFADQIKEAPERLVAESRAALLVWGDWETKVSARSRMLKIAFTGSLRESSLITDLGVSTTDSDRPKIHAAMRLYVGEARNKS